jgi:hypothetical protein
MCWLKMRFLGRVLIVALLPAHVGAQTIARTFEELQALLKPGEYVLVIDRNDRETWGKVADVSTSTLRLFRVLKGDRDGRIETTSDRQLFSEENVARILRSDASGRRGAAVYPASWDKVDVLPASTAVTVVLETGERRRYRFAQSDRDNLRVLTTSGQLENLQKSRVRRVERHGVADQTVDGIALGALIGAGTGLGLMGIAYASACETCDAPEPGPMFLAAGTFSAGIGGFVGWLIDKLHKGKETVFPAVSPMVSHERRGVAVSLRF